LGAWRFSWAAGCVCARIQALYAPLPPYGVACLFILLLVRCLRGLTRSARVPLLGGATGSHSASTDAHGAHGADTASTGARTHTTTPSPLPSDDVMQVGHRSMHLPLFPLLCSVLPKC
jgi:hypothetical protein